jgi:hypothetical protein
MNESVNWQFTDVSVLRPRIETNTIDYYRTKQLMTEREHTMTKVQQKLTSDLESSREIIGRKILFDDTKNSIFNQRNVPTFDTGAEVSKVI